MNMHKTSRAFRLSSNHLHVRVHFVFIIIMDANRATWTELVIPFDGSFVNSLSVVGIRQMAKFYSWAYIDDQFNSETYDFRGRFTTYNAQKRNSQSLLFT